MKTIWMNFSRAIFDFALLLKAIWIKFKCKQDDPSIKNEEKLFRRIPPSQFVEGEISDAVFEEVECSVERESKSTPEKCLAHNFVPDGYEEKNIVKKSGRLIKKGWAVISIQTQTARNLNQKVHSDPLTIQLNNGEQIINDAHTLICGVKTRIFIADDLAQAAKLELPKPELS